MGVYIPGPDLRLPGLRLVSAAAGPFANHPTLATGLVSYWALDEASGTRYDSVVASGNDLTDNNTVGSVAGKLNNAASFVAANSESLSLAGGLTALSDNFTVDFWVAAAVVTREGLLTNGNGIGLVPLGFTVEDNVFGAGDLLIITRNDGGTYCYTSTGVITTDGSAFQHVVITYATAASPAVHVYINGVDKALTFAGAPSVLGAGNLFSLGRRGDTPRFFTGRQDEVGLWSRVLTAQERTDLWAADAGLFYGS